jgi:NTP pyrophosphatase (non-canonical NTP hydrolase)
MAEIRDEVADIAAYVLSFAHTMGIDIASALEHKMEKNAEKYPAEKFRGRFR